MNVQRSGFKIREVRQVEGERENDEQNLRTSKIGESRRHFGSHLEEAGAWAAVRGRAGRAEEKGSRQNRGVER